MFVYMRKQVKKPFFKSREDVISMFLGLVVVVAVVGFMVNFIEKRKGNVDVPGVSNNVKTEEEIKIENKEIVVVEKNDSLWKIAERVYGDGYKWVEIAKANDLKDPGLIYSGQKLNLPKIESQIVNEENKSEDIEYQVVRGDNLWKIAIKFYGDGYQWTKIWQTNRSKLNSPDELEIGMTLLIYAKI